MWRVHTVHLLQLRRSSKLVCTVNGSLEDRNKRTCDFGHSLVRCGDRSIWGIAAPSYTRHMLRSIPARGVGYILREPWTTESRILMPGMYQERTQQQQPTTLPTVRSVIRVPRNDQSQNRASTQARKQSASTGSLRKAPVDSRKTEREAGAGREVTWGEEGTKNR